MDIARKILSERKKRNWTQATLAEKSGLLQPAIARYERGESPSPKNLIKICKAFELPTEFFTQSHTSLNVSPKPSKEEEIDDFELRKLLKEIKTYPLEEQTSILNLLRSLSRLRRYESIK